MSIKTFYLVRRIILATVLALSGSLPCTGALPSTNVFEVRPTVGSDSNGGCFDSAGTGTDYSQQNSAEYSFTDLVIAATTTNVTSVSHSFVAADQGNCLHISAGTGFTTGWYEIVSVATGIATLDRSAGSAASTGGTWLEGGALATVSQANSLVVGNNLVWVKASGTYTVTSSMTVNTDSSTGSHGPLTFEGYTSSRGDGGQVTWTTSTNSIDLVDFVNANNVAFKNFVFSSTAGTPGNGAQASASGISYAVSFYNCSFTGFATAILGNYNVNWAFDPLVVVNSRIYENTVGILNSTNTYILGSKIDSNKDQGAEIGGGQPSNWDVEYTVFYDNGTSGTFAGLDLSTGSNNNGTFVIIDHCDFSSNSGDGVKSSGLVFVFVQASNSIFDSNGGYGFNGQSGAGQLTPFLLNNNAFYNNTGGKSNLPLGVNSITLTASPYVSIGTNFALNSTSGGGAALTGTGFPGIIPNAGTGYASVGALQPSSGGGSASQHGYPLVQ